jgi:CheY-like chemotaxis protein
MPGDARPSVLVLDDYDDNRHVLTALLEGKGYRVLEAESGAQALDVARRERPDLILMDLTLRDMGGMEAVRRIRDVEGLVGRPSRVAPHMIRLNTTQQLWPRDVPRTCLNR